MTTHDQRHHARTQTHHRPPPRRPAACSWRSRSIPALNVLSVSIRPGNQLRSTDLSIIPADWSFHNYIAIFTEQPFLRWLGNSLLVSTVVTLTGVALASIGGYAFSRFRFVGRQSLLVSILTTQMFPATMLLLPLYILVAQLHLLDTYLGLMIFYTSTALPFCIWQMKGFYDTIPVSLEDAARVDGCTPHGSLLARHAAARRAGPRDHGPVQLHDRLERIHRRRPGHAGRRNVHAPARASRASKPTCRPNGASTPPPRSW